MTEEKHPQTTKPAASKAADLSLVIPGPVLFTCNMNSVRSPMAACLFSSLAGKEARCDSAGLYPGWRDPFTDIVLSEMNLSLGDRESKTLAAIDLSQFALLIAMTPEVAGELRKLADKEKVEFWPIDNPSTAAGGQEAVLAAYRSVRDDIAQKICARFKIERNRRT